MTLLEIIQKYGYHKTDKHTGHAYIPHVYDQIFEPLRDKKLNILEIGTREGDSLRLWRKYFPNAQIFGVDNDESGKVNNFQAEGITMIMGDGYSDEVVKQLPKMDIIIDDGPHSLESQLLCLEKYMPRLKKGGQILIEDIAKFEYIDLLEAKYHELGYEKEVVYYDLRHIKRRFDDIIVQFFK